MLIFSILSIVLGIQTSFAQVVGSTEQSLELWSALKNQNVGWVVKLLDSGVSPELNSDVETPLTYSIKINSESMVTELLKHGANPNGLQPISQHTPLMVAVHFHRSKMVELLLHHHADVNITGIAGRGPLQIAALLDDVEDARILLNETNVDVNARGNLCALAIASRQGYADFVILLLSLVKTPPTPVCLQSAIKMADYNQHADILKLLKTAI